MRVGILGATGYSGAVLFSLLKQHPQVTEIDLYGHEGQSTARRLLADEIPAFSNAALPIVPFVPQDIMATTDCLFCATPAGITKNLMEPFIAQNFPVIDLSGDYRLKDPTQYEKWYHKKAAPSHLLKEAEYGLSEFLTHPGHYIANPGCYATATLLGLAPLALKKLIEPTSIIVDAKSGISGAGKKLSATSHYTFINENACLYKINEHQHIPEIMQQLQQWNAAIPAIQFTTTLIPITRGIMVTIYAKAAAGLTATQIQAAYAQVFAQSPFVRLRNHGFPTIQDVKGSNYCDIGYNYNPKTNTITVVATIDNLLKGAAGQAVQNFNKLSGFTETAGLPELPSFP
ncbi:N-acetyl-gamma-glutamyl-phosphate reductase [Liquorilactobacillus satsumensis]|uniref:N-acetyl-gamma-glutamyl-phosphate reductase n=1 Tax=Liquorilactobacillus satsumensis TaxID=259059 RepID=UPI001E5A573A|nr:N-acetyl-gamma-glutamyl-phosphate reductase [Liquorilactobacillus satsumensis]MCC7666931.1 N-acetyl-gamma-glutamyl-phosphate reductase [Liquorilactobacillus satsumensis]MCP9357213.1 N-acetyl-gamma-glutamyl-phosphate reductase [Liquorilactobacillus satsumensis]MCP9371160.1 N-acetyl-gamma-glutamyl-phosphate reductase [Liquorilactobacillus satsumensis]